MTCRPIFSSLSPHLSASDKAQRCPSPAQDSFCRRLSQSTQSTTPRPTSLVRPALQSVTDQQSFQIRLDLRPPCSRLLRLHNLPPSPHPPSLPACDPACPRTLVHRYRPFAKSMSRSPSTRTSCSTRARQHHLVPCPSRRLPYKQRLGVVALRSCQQVRPRRQALCLSARLRPLASSPGRRHRRRTTRIGSTCEASWRISRRRRNSGGPASRSSRLFRRRTLRYPPLAVSRRLRRRGDQCPLRVPRHSPVSSPSSRRRRRRSAEHPRRLPYAARLPYSATRLPHLLPRFAPLLLPGLQPDPSTPPRE